MILKRILNNDKKAALMIIMLAVGLLSSGAQASFMEIGLGNFFEVEEFSFNTSDKVILILPEDGLQKTADNDQDLKNSVSDHLIRDSTAPQSENMELLPMVDIADVDQVIIDYAKAYAQQNNIDINAVRNLIAAAFTGASMNYNSVPRHEAYASEVYANVTYPQYATAANAGSAHQAVDTTLFARTILWLMGLFTSGTAYQIIGGIFILFIGYKVLRNMALSRY